MARNTAKRTDKALLRLLKTKEKEILDQGYDSVEEFIAELKKVPVNKLLKFRKTLPKEKSD